MSRVFWATYPLVAVFLVGAIWVPWLVFVSIGFAAVGLWGVILTGALEGGFDAAWEQAERWRTWLGTR